eukprot:COSAG01_NODE_11401_length_1943_cov_1.156725_2_plen_211_part_00
MYPIVQFAGIHPASTITLDSDPTTLQLARHTVWGQNFMSRWSPVNGLCLAWPSAAKIVDGGAPPTSEFGTSTLLDAFEQALNRTMQPNLWPSMNGGGVEQVGATQACNDLFLQSVGGSLRFFPGWEPGAAVSFDRLRTIGAFLVSASRDAGGGVHGVSIVSEVGGRCSIRTATTPTVTCQGTGTAVAVSCKSGNCAFDTNPGTTYTIADL